MIEVLDILEKIIVPVLLVYMVHVFEKRNKKADIDIEKVKELNIVISNMLKCWHYLIRLQSIIVIYEEKSESLLVPKQFLPFVTLHSGALNDACFEDLDDSIEMLKKYDAVGYYELEGIGKRYHHFKSIYTIPFLQSENPTEVGLHLNRHFMDRLLNEIEEHLRSTSKKISKEVYKQVENKINVGQQIATKDYIEELNIEFYDFIIAIMPPEIERPSYDEFSKDFRDPAIQEQFLEQFRIIARAGIDQVSKMLMHNPSLTMEQIEEMIRDTQPTI